MHLIPPSSFTKSHTKERATHGGSGYMTTAVKEPVEQFEGMNKLHSTYLSPAGKILSLLFLAGAGSVYPKGRSACRAIGGCGMI